jgi:hypothetical protein
MQSAQECCPSGARFARALYSVELGRKNLEALFSHEHMRGLEPALSDPQSKSPRTLCKLIMLLSA